MLRMSNPGRRTETETAKLSCIQVETMLAKIITNTELQ